MAHFLYPNFNPLHISLIILARQLKNIITCRPTLDELDVQLRRYRMSATQQSHSQLEATDRQGEAVPLTPENSARARR